MVEALAHNCRKTYKIDSFSDPLDKQTNKTNNQKKKNRKKIMKDVWKLKQEESLWVMKRDMAEPL